GPARGDRAAAARHPELGGGALADATLTSCNRVAADLAEPWRPGGVLWQRRRRTAGAVRAGGRRGRNSRIRIILQRRRGPRMDGAARPGGCGQW
nr:hypothetical protein [Tanacetum cinerariifolium]